MSKDIPRSSHTSSIRGPPQSREKVHVKADEIVGLDQPVPDAMIRRDRPEDAAGRVTVFGWKLVVSVIEVR